VLRADPARPLTTPADLRGWLADRGRGSFADPEVAGRAARDLVARLEVPLPGSGRTAERLRTLAALGEADLALARLAEGHLDALAVLAETGAPVHDRDGSLWGVWAADPPHARPVAEETDEGWRLTGTKAWCSGARACTDALVTAHASDGYRLFAVAREAWVPVPGTWPAFALAGTDSLDVRLDGSPATPVGGPGAYLDRPGFWHGGTGVAAVWYGGAVGVARALPAARRPLDGHALAHLGAVDVLLYAARTALLAAADEIDADPADRTGTAARRAGQARALVERTATEVVDRVGRALGAAPLALDHAHGRRVADLALYLRQSHGERDLEGLGRDVLAAGEAW
jgi:alkylation response protein AidB-like acyl-CoA dehydrogenase